jgi:hypothetical protein
MYQRHRPLRTKIVRAARVGLAAMLLAVLLSGSVPFTSVPAQATCNLACCIGKAPHAAGSCMGGSCRSGVLSSDHATHTHQITAPEEAETLCGLPNQIGATTVAQMAEVPTIEADGSVVKEDVSDVGQASQNVRDQVHISAAALVKPCQEDCGGCVSGFTNLNRQRNTAIVNHSDPSLPPSTIQLANLEFHLRQTLAALCLQCGPRAPPRAES